MPQSTLPDNQRLPVSARHWWLVVIAILLLAVCGCDSDDTTTDNGGCAEGTLACDDVCCPGDATEYACYPDSEVKCQLISCNDGLYFCGSGCIPVSANCCNQDTGTYCQTGEACCGDGCMPIGSSCCGNGSYCPVGSVCCYDGTQCC